MCGGGSFNCSKNTLVGLNIIYILVSFLLIGVASYSKSSAVITSLPIVGGILACGIFLLFIAVLGLWGTVKHHQVALFFYMIILFLIFCIQFSVACAALAVDSETEKNILGKAWDKSSNETRLSFEKHFGCCSFDDVNDASQAISCQEIPACKPVGNSTELTCKDCFATIQPVMSKAFSSAGGVGLFFSFTELIGIYASYKFRCHIQSSGQLP